MRLGLDVRELVPHEAARRLAHRAATARKCWRAAQSRGLFFERADYFVCVLSRSFEPNARLSFFAEVRAEIRDEQSARAQEKRILVGEKESEKQRKPAQHERRNGKKQLREM